MLHIIATPIGNLKDITYRAIETLASCDYCLCEDTRESIKLLNAYNLKIPLKSYHKFNEASSVDQIIKDLKDGKEIALISDAGTPLISDPGSILIKALIQNQIPFTHLPGPSASTFAYLASGFHENGYSFHGFIPKKKAALDKEFLNQIQSKMTSIYYLSPRQVTETLKSLNVLCPERPLFLGKEFTKFFESFFHGTASEITNTLKDKVIKGEWVLAIAPRPKDAYHHIDPLEHVSYLEDTYKISRKDAIKLSAEILMVPKRLIYAKEHHEKGDS